MIIKNNRIDVVISIDKDAFDRIKNNTMTDGDGVRMGISVCSGKPLPKGHGRLIYASDVGEYLTLADVPTIIEADKSGECEKTSKTFPKDCTKECQYYRRWDLSVDDYTNVCDKLDVQVDDCDAYGPFYVPIPCPLEKKEDNDANCN